MNLGNSFALQGKKVWVAGHRGLVGSALVRRLDQEDCELLTVDRSGCDLRDRRDVETWFNETHPDVILLAAARVGGIYANDVSPVDFLYDNLTIQTNVIDAAHRHQVEKLVFLGSSCVYPRLAPQPIPEEALLTGPLEETNQWYATAKIAGLKLCQAYRRQHGCDFVSVMPSNLYGPGDRFDLRTSHVVPALIAKAHQAKRDAAPVMEVWGTGQPLREFLHVDDAADAIIFVLKNYSGEQFLNIGSSNEISIADLAMLVRDIVGFRGRVRFDTARPDGTPRKVVDISRIKALGWTPRISLADGLAQTYRWYVDHCGTSARGPALDHA
jgi:GDP-L-fucose synthase